MVVERVVAHHARRVGREQLVPTAAPHVVERGSGIGGSERHARVLPQQVVARRQVDEVGDLAARVGKDGGADAVARQRDAGDAVVDERGVGDRRFRHGRHTVESEHDGARSGPGRPDPRLARLADRRRRRARVRVHARRLAAPGADRRPLLRAAGRRTRRRRSTASAASTPATTRNAALFYAHRSGSAVVGRTKLWGRVVEHEAGWRAERAYPECDLRAARALPRTRPTTSRPTSRVATACRCTWSTSSGACCATRIWRRSRRATSRCRALPEWIARRVRPQPLAEAREAAAAGAEPAPPPSGGDGFLRRLVPRAALRARSSGSGAGHRILDRLDDDHTLRLADLHAPMLHRAPAPSGPLPTLLTRGRSTN